MKGATTFTGRVEGGKLRLDNRAAFDRFTRLLDGKRVELQLRKYKRKRTLKQNSFYWPGIVEPLADYFGYEIPDDMHYELRRMFLSVPINDELVKVRSTTELSTEEFTKYMERCMQFAAENGVYLAFPDEEAA